MTGIPGYGLAAPGQAQLLAALTAAVALTSPRR